MKFVTMTAAAALLGAGTAFAGGIMPAPSEPLVMAPAAPMMADDWTGGYAGLSLGYGSGDFDDVDDSDFDGAIGGIFGGYRYDFGNFVVGVEADVNAANLEFDFDDDVKIDQVHRLKLTAGYDLGQALVYGVAGAAYAELTDDDFDEDFDDTGYVLGAGVDYKITPNVIVGAEVLYHDFDDFDDADVDVDVTTVQARVAYKF